MRLSMKSFSFSDHWPPIVGALVAVSIPLALLGLSNGPLQVSQSRIEPDMMMKVSEKENLNGQEREIPNGSATESVRVSVSEIKSEVPDASELKESSELKRRIADWRYTGYLKAPGKRIALVQRMQRPDRPLRIAEGDFIQEVRVEEVSSDRILVSYRDDREEIYLDQRDPFDLPTVEIPTELADRPEELADLVFAQTLGRYLPEGGAMTLVGDEAQEENEALQALSETEGLPEPFYGDTVEDFAERLAENPPDGLDPSGYKLSDEVRNRLFGF
jgi:hypothetical protein